MVGCRLERPRAVVGLAASCILVALRHAGPLSASPPRPAVPHDASSAAGSVEGADGSTGQSTHDPLDHVLSTAAAAADAFIGVLGRALEARFSEHLGRAVLTTVMSALLNCWPPPPLADPSGTTSRSALMVEPEPQSRARGEEDDGGGGGRRVASRGYAMGWWRLEQGGNLRRSASSGGGGSSSISSGECLVRASPNSNRPSAPEGIICVDGGVTALGAGVSAKMAGQDNAAGEGYAAASSGAGGTTPPADEDDQRDEYGSWDGFADDADLDALLSGRSTTPAGNQSGDMAAAVALSEAEASAASAAAAAATVAAAAEKKTQEEQELWQSLARGAQTHVLPHLHDILKRSYTIVRFAQGPSSSCRRITSATASGAPRSMSTGARGSSTLAEAPPDAALGKSAAGAPWAALPGDSEVDARLALELHAIAAFVSLRGSLGGNGVGDGSNHGSNRRDGKAGSFGYHTVRDKYLDVHRMTGNPLTPQQRLLAPAFFCIALGLHRVVGRGSGDAMYARRGEATPEGRSLCVEGCPPSRPASLLAEALRGKEWDMLQLWVQVALDPLAFPSPRRSNDRHPRRRSSRQGRAGNGSGRGSSEPSDVVRKRFEGFTRCLSAAFAPGVTAGCGSDGGGDKGGGSGGRGGRGWQQAQTIDKDVVGVFEKRLSRFEPAQLASLSSNESKVRDFALI